MKHLQHGPPTILYDNSLAISLTKNPVMHEKIKHIEIKYRDLGKKKLS